jgi:hypothetical protein
MGHRVMVCGVSLGFWGPVLGLELQYKIVVHIIALP